MKLMLEIDTLAHRMRVNVRGESSRAAEVEAAYAARRFAGLLHPYVLEFELITSVGRLLWPNIVFPGEPGYDEAPFIGERPPAAGTPEKRRERDCSKAPKPGSATAKPGSATAKALDAVQRLGTTDLRTIADEIDLADGPCAAILTRLCKGGFLEPYEKGKAR